MVQTATIRAFQQTHRSLIAGTGSSHSKSSSSDLSRVSISICMQLSLGATLFFMQLCKLKDLLFHQHCSIWAMALLAFAIHVRFKTVLRCLFPTEWTAIFAKEMKHCLPCTRD